MTRCGTLKTTSSPLGGRCEGEVFVEFVQVVGPVAAVRGPHGTSCISSFPQTSAASETGYTVHSVRTFSGGRHGEWEGRCGGGRM